MIFNFLPSNTNFCISALFFFFLISVSLHRTIIFSLFLNPKQVKRIIGEFVWNIFYCMLSEKAFKWIVSCLRNRCLVSIMICVKCCGFHCNRLIENVCDIAIQRYYIYIMLLDDFFTILNFLWSSAHRVSLCCSIYQRFVSTSSMQLHRLSLCTICNKKDIQMSRCARCVFVWVLSIEYVIDSVRLKWWNDTMHISTLHTTPWI